MDTNAGWIGWLVLRLRLLLFILGGCLGEIFWAERTDGGMHPKVHGGADCAFAVHKECEGI